MKAFTALLALCLLLSPACLVAQSAPTNAPSQGGADPESTLALQVAEIASSPKLSAPAKQRRIANLVRRTIVAATAKADDPGQALSIAVALATAAAHAAPEFTQVIVNTVISIPSIASVDGAMGAVRTAITAAASPETQQGGNNPGNQGANGNSNGNANGNGNSNGNSNGTFEQSGQPGNNGNNGNNGGPVGSPSR